eukprot:1145149-Pelagomonas_calceolata.AAC.3
MSEVGAVCAAGPQALLKKNFFFVISAFIKCARKQCVQLDLMLFFSRTGTSKEHIRICESSARPSKPSTSMEQSEQFKPGLVHPSSWQSALSKFRLSQCFAQQLLKSPFATCDCREPCD